MLTASVFELVEQLQLVEQFYHAADICNVANAVSASADQP